MLIDEDSSGEHTYQVSSVDLLGTFDGCGDLLLMFRGQEGQDLREYCTQPLRNLLLHEEKARKRSVLNVQDLCD